MSRRTVSVKLQDRVPAKIAATARVKSPAVSLWDRMQDLVIEDDLAPADLASNKARLRGYGRSRTR